MEKDTIMKITKVEVKDQCLHSVLPNKPLYKQFLHLVEVTSEVPVSTEVTSEATTGKVIIKLHVLKIRYLNPI